MKKRAGIAVNPMSTALVGLGVMFFVGTASATTIYNNSNGGGDYWHPLGNPNTATYGETFTAPSGADTSLSEFGFYMGDPVNAGDIKLQAYIASWTGSQAGSLLFSSATVDFANTGAAFLDFNAGGLSLTPGGSYIMFLSVSQNYGMSSGEAYIQEGSSSIPGGGFAYYNNGGNFSGLFANTWDQTGLTPNWAVQATFGPAGAVPDGGSLTILEMGIFGGILYLKRFCS